MPKFQHGNVICAKRSFVKKNDDYVLSKKSYLEQLKKIYLNFFSNLKFFSVFLVKVLHIVSADQKKNIDVLYKKKIKNSKVELHPSKSFFSRLVQTLAFF